MWKPSVSNMSFTFSGSVKSITSSVKLLMSMTPTTLRSASMTGNAKNL